MEVNKYRVTPQATTGIAPAELVLGQRITIHFTYFTYFTLPFSERLMIVFVVDKYIHYIDFQNHTGNKIPQYSTLPSKIIA